MLAEEKKQETYSSGYPVKMEHLTIPRLALCMNVVLLEVWEKNEIRKLQQIR